MDTGKAICLGSVLIALAIVAPEIVKLKQVEYTGVGKYMGSGADGGDVWVVNTQTGQVRRCYATHGMSHSKSPHPAGCFAWSE